MSGGETTASIFCLDDGNGAWNHKHTRVLVEAYTGSSSHCVVLVLAEMIRRDLVSIAGAVRCGVQHDMRSDKKGPGLQFSRWTILEKVMPSKSSNT